jgi:hypothetical protein
MTELAEDYVERRIWKWELLRIAFRPDNIFRARYTRIFSCLFQQRRR